VAFFLYQSIRPPNLWFAFSPASMREADRGISFTAELQLHFLFLMVVPDFFFPLRLGSVLLTILQVAVILFFFPPLPFFPFQKGNFVFSSHWPFEIRILVFAQNAGPLSVAHPLPIFLRRDGRCLLFCWDQQIFCNSLLSAHLLSPLVTTDSSPQGVFLDALSRNVAFRYCLFWMLL